jgi:hypothetical protein
MASDTKLGRCPNPDCKGGVVRIVFNRFRSWQVRCYGCGVAGPFNRRCEQAADAWNKLSQMADLLAAYGEPSTCSDCGPQKLCTEECDKMGDAE